MRKRIMIVFVSWLTALSPSGISSAETIFSYNSGHDYLEMSEDFRDLYVQGLLDQWFLLLAIYDDYETLVWLEDCTFGLTSDQIAERFSDWLDVHGEDLDLTAPELFIAAMLDTCEADT